MRVAPNGWETLFSGIHVTEYKLVIGNQDYLADNILSNPIFNRPLLDQPAIGRVCSATMTVTILPIENVTIPKAAPVSVYCRLASRDRTSTTDWILIGQFNISSRSGSKRLILKCRDDMTKAGQTYYDKMDSQISWPAQQSVVVDDIARIMGVQLDGRTVINTGAAYRAALPSPDILITEMLSYIGVCNGGNWIITEEGKLRLVPLASPFGEGVQALGTQHNGYTETGIDVTISRVTITDDEDEAYTAGTDTGYEITAYCPYIVQDVVDNLATALSGVIYRPYRMENARINPLLELGDTISATKKDGTTITVVLNTASISCNIGYTATLETKAENDAEEEIPYQTPQQIKDARSIRSDRTYYGAALDRGSGLVIRRVQGENEQARVVFNADEMAFYQGNTAVLYFDAQEQHWKLNGSIEIETHDGSNITTLTDINGRVLTIEETVDGITITDPTTGTTVIDGGSIETDDLYIDHLYARSQANNSYVQMLDEGLRFVFGVGLEQIETINIGYNAAEVPQPYILFGAGDSPQLGGLGMVKKYAEGIWVGDATDIYRSEITNGTGLFIDATNRKIYKYTQGSRAELADTSNVVAVFG